MDPMQNFTAAQMQSFKDAMVQLDSSKIVRRIGLAILTAMAALNVACSTPVVPNTYENSGTSWWAYQQCLSTLRGNTNASACDGVGTTNSSSYTDYTLGANTYASPYEPTDAPFSNYRYKASRVGRRSAQADETTLSSVSQSETEVLADDRAVAYKAYLEALDPATQAELTEKWLNLAKQASVASGATVE